MPQGIHFEVVLFAAASYFYWKKLRRTNFASRNSCVLLTYIEIYGYSTNDTCHKYYQVIDKNLLSPTRSLNKIISTSPQNTIDKLPSQLFQKLLPTWRKPFKLFLIPWYLP